MKFTLDDVVDLAEALGCPEYVGAGPSIVLPDGTVYDLTDVSDRSTHAKFFRIIFDERREELLDEYPEDDDVAYELYQMDDDIKIMDHVERDLGIVTLNSGRTYVEPRAKMVMLRKPTAEQYSVIEDFLFDIEAFKDSVIIFLGKDAHFVQYYFDEMTPDEIFYEIKAFFAGVRIRESADDKSLKGVKVLYRDGQFDDFEHGLFFTDSIDYFSHNSEFIDANPKAYEVDFSDAKVFDPINEWKMSVDTWSTFRQEQEFLDSVGFDDYEFLDDVDYEDEKTYHEVITDTDALAKYAKEHGYDAVVFWGVPSDYGYGPEFNEYCVFNKDIVKPADDRIDEEMISSERFDMIATDDPREVARSLSRFDEGARIFIDEDARVGEEGLTLYLVGDIYSCTHSDMVDLAKENGYDTRINDYDAQKVCALYYPKNIDIDYNGDIKDDYYDHMYEYGDFVIFSRYSDFDDFELSKAFGKHRAVPYEEMLELFD